jgi:hypothetical protein
MSCDAPLSSTVWWVLFAAWLVVGEVDGRDRWPGVFSCCGDGGSRCCEMKDMRLTYIGERRCEDLVDGAEDVGCRYAFPPSRFSLNHSTTKKEAERLKKLERERKAEEERQRAEVATLHAAHLT